MTTDISSQPITCPSDQQLLLFLAHKGYPGICRSSQKRCAFNNAFFKFTSSDVTVPPLRHPALLSVVGFWGLPDHCVSSWFKFHERTLLTVVVFLQQAVHVTHRPAIVSKNRSQGLSQQLSNLQIRRMLKKCFN